jgi:uncharacterized protein
MIRDFLFALGMVAIVEGLVLALAPTRVRNVLEMLDAMSIGQRRSVALATLALGIAIVWLLG